MEQDGKSELMAGLPDIIAPVFLVYASGREQAI